MLEVHHANSIDRGQAMISGPIEVGNYSGAMSMTSLVAGTTFELRNFPFYLWGTVNYNSTGIGNVALEKRR